jgi:hypothetical protein
VLWDVDYTLLSAVGLGNRLYRAVFKDMFGRDLTAIAPKAGRTDRAILLDTLALAGVAEPRAHVDAVLAALARRRHRSGVRSGHRTGLKARQTSGRGMSGLVRRERSTSRPERMRAWMSSLTSQTLTFIPAITRPCESQNEMNPRAARSPR